jgi:hypothetical protein
VRLTFIQLPTFVSDWRRLKLNDDDLRALEAVLMTDPSGGPVMSGTGGLRKLRFAPPSWRKGKSGATRVGYVYFLMHETIALVVMYSKDEKDNLSASERQQVKAVVDRIKQCLAKE